MSACSASADAERDPPVAPAAVDKATRSRWLLQATPLLPGATGVPQRAGTVARRLCRSRRHRDWRQRAQGLGTRTVAYVTSGMTTGRAHHPVSGPQPRALSTARTATFERRQPAVDRPAAVGPAEEQPDPGRGGSARNAVRPVAPSHSGPPGARASPPFVMVRQRRRIRPPGDRTSARVSGRTPRTWTAAPIPRPLAD